MNLVLALLCSLFLSAMTADGPANPDTLPAESRRDVEAAGAALVEAINTPDDAARAAAIAKIIDADLLARVGAERIEAQFKRLHETYGTLEFHHADLSEGKQGNNIRRVLHVFAKSDKSGRWHDFQVRVQPEAPNRLREIVFIAEVSEPVYLPNGDFSDPGTSKWFDSYIDGLVAKEKLSGSVLLAVGDRAVFERYFGFADAAQKVPMTPHTRLNLGSGNKMFTALAIMLLEEQGRLRLDDPISKYFADFPDKEAADKITIANLISHTSGVGEYWTEETREAVRAADGAKDLKALVYQAGIRFPAGEQYAYSNSNFVLAGLIVEKASGQDYDVFVRDTITGPLGMHDTDTFRMDGDDPTLAERLTRDGDHWKPLPKGKRGSPAGGGYSTPRDILAFAQALEAGRIVPRDTLARMTSSQTPSALRDPANDYGFGFILGRAGRNPYYGHGGITGGVNFEFRHYPSLDATLITFCNQDNGAYDDLRRTAEKLLTGVR